ncbi:MAG TPA: hypothetical protein VFQ61_30630, partial [Polyangiaceae bacterium]|nr:hypothetical protein [Polyangiaceae bacterium]
TVAAWDHPEEFFSAFDWLEVDARSDGCRSFLQACQGRPLLAKVARSRATPDVFTELIRLGRAGPSVRRRLLTSLARSFFMNVQDWCGLCKRLSRARRPLASHLLETLALSGITEAVSAPATEWLEESEYFGARVSKLLQYLLRGAGALATYSIADWAFKSGGPDSHISGSQVWEVLLIVVALLLLQSWWDARRRVDPQSRELFSKLWAFAEASRSAGGHR